MPRTVRRKDVAPIPPCKIQVDVEEDSYPCIVNVVAKATFDCPINLEVLVHDLWNVELRRNAFPALLIRFRHPRACTSIYATGSILLRSPRRETANKSIEKLFHLVRRTHPDVKFPQLKFCNMFGASDLGFYIHLNPLIASLGRNAHENEGQFRLAIIRTGTPRVTAHVSHTGFINYKGACSEEEMDLAHEKIYPHLHFFLDEFETARQRGMQSGSDLQEENASQSGERGEEDQNEEEDENEEEEEH